MAVEAVGMDTAQQIAPNQRGAFGADAQAFQEEITAHRQRLANENGVQLASADVATVGSAARVVIPQLTASTVAGVALRAVVGPVGYVGSVAPTDMGQYRSGTVPGHPDVRYEYVMSERGLAFYRVGPDGKKGELLWAGSDDGIRYDSSGVPLVNVEALLAGQNPKVTAGTAGVEKNESTARMSVVPEQLPQSISTPNPEPQIPEAISTPIPEPRKPEVISTPIPAQQKPEAVGGGFQPVNTLGNASIIENGKEGSTEAESLVPGEHAEKRRSEAAAGDAARDVGDPNRTAREGREYTDAETGNTVYVKGDRVVITDGHGNQVTQFKNSRKNTQERIVRGKWIPK